MNTFKIMRNVLLKKPLLFTFFLLLNRNLFTI